MPFRGRPTRRRMPTLLLRATVLGISLSLMGTSAQAVSYAVEKTSGRPGVQGGKPLKGKGATARPMPADPTKKHAVTRLDTAVWPSGGSAEIPVSRKPAKSARSARQGGTARPTAPRPTPRTEVGGLPMAVASAAPPAGQAATGSPAPSKVRVEVLPRQRAAALGAGAVFRVQHTDRAAPAVRLRLTVEYSAFAEGFGGSYGSRLQLVQLPACAAVAAPGSKNCRDRPTPVKSVNDGGNRTVDAFVTIAAAAGAPGAVLGSSLFALTANPSSSQGTFAATSLSPSATWNVGKANGNFTWSYPLRTVPVPGSLGPSVALSYNSQTTDGRTSVTNNQGSWVGEGFSYEPGFIERRYKPCSDDGHTNSAEQCWAFDNATIMLNGSSSELIKDDTTGEWRMSQPDGSKVEKLTGAANGDDNGEHWRITTADGKQYFFGLGRLPGWTTGKEETGSVWTAPVFGDDSGEPCYSATFANAHCQQAWRWNLDYVKDAHDNVQSAFYTKEKNHYALRAQTGVNGTEYIRGGHLKRIDYGQRHNQVYAAKAPARVTFNVVERCLPDASFACNEAQRTAANATRWPDVPIDRECAASTHCSSSQISQTFFTTKRLKSVVTQMRNGATTYQDVDAWTLKHLFLENGDDSKSLWLSTIGHEGRVGTPVSVPALQIFGTSLENRVDAIGDNIAPLRRFRMATVVSETGAQLDINYKPAECTVPTLPAPGESVKRCYPVRWAAPGFVDPIDDWFHKYVVGEVVQTDLTGNSDQMINRYDYNGPAGWRHTEPDGMTEAKFLTWGQWQGYGQVSITSGSHTQQHNRVDYRFFQGMHGDKLPGGGTRNAQVTASNGDTYTDDEDYGGFELEAATYGNGAVASKVIKKPWKHHTATQTRTWGTIRATLVDIAQTLGYTAVAGGWRQTESNVTYDTTTGTGRTVRTEDLGRVVPTTASAAEKLEAAKDDTCTRVWYADNTSGAYNFLGSVKREEKVAVACDTTPDLQTQVISDTLTEYDGLTHGAAPTRGLPTKVKRLASYTGSTPNYQTAAVNSTVYDQYGRITSTTTPGTGTTTTAYTMTNGLTTRTTVTNAANHTTHYDYEPAWGQTAGQTDPNGKRTDLAHDGLGRMVSLWYPDRIKTQTPSIKYTYLVRNNAPVTVKKEAIEESGSYGLEYTHFDSLLRPRQTQADGPGSTRLVADTFHDSWGRIKATHDTYQATGGPSDTLLTVPLGHVPTRTQHEFDDMGRPTANVLLSGGVEQWRTTTVHEGDRTHVIPPQGGIPQTSVTDVAGRVTELQHYQSGTPGSAGPVAFTSTKYTYTPAGRLKTVSDPQLSVWSFTYDQRGRKTRSVDPDAGTTDMTYDDADRVVDTIHVGSQNRTRNAYDSLGRPTTVHDLRDAPNGPGTLLTDRKYDRAGMLGREWATYSYTGTGTEAFVRVIQLWDDFYRPKRTAYGLPASLGMGTIYTFDTAYNWDGTVQSSGLPASGALPAEVIAYSYDELRRTTGVNGIGQYVSNAIWSPSSELLQYEQNLGTRKVWNTYQYETGTERLKRSQVDIAGSTGGPAKQVDYSYDKAGNVLSMADTGTASATADVQCFRYDANKRLSEAWTPSATTTTASGFGTIGTPAPLEGSGPSACTADPGASALGGPAAYWKSYRTDSVGNRTQDVTHDTGLNASQNVTRAFTYGEGTAGPHSVTKVTTTGPTGSSNSLYAYDAAGNTTTRTVGGNTDTLAWGPTGSLERVNRPDDVTTTPNEASETTFKYDADGNRTLRVDPGGKTVYLPDTELHIPTGQTAVQATRYYAFAGKTVAVRTNSSQVTIQSSDHHGTGDVSVDPVTGTATSRRSDPYGNSRGTAPASWPGSKGFVGGTIDAGTGLTHLGAREYDPGLGKFISVDPLIDYTNAQQMNGYAYANNSPVTYSDPSGLITAECGRGEYACSPNGAGGFNGKPKKSEKPPTEAEKAVYRAEAEKIIAGSDTGEVVKKIVKLVKDIAGISAVENCISDPTVGNCAMAVVEIGLTLAGSALKMIFKGKKIVKAIDLLDDLKDTIDKSRDAEKRLDRAKSGLKREKELGSCPTPHSFLPDALVVMADGTRKKIKDVELGDKTLGTNPQNGEDKYLEVVGTIVTEDDKEFVDLTIVTPEGAGALTSTVTHPFWVPAKKQWIRAGDLQPGMELRTPGGGTAELAGLDFFRKKQRTHDLTIAGVHAYYVVAGATPVLVHNCNKNQGVYIFDDMSKPGHVYIGKTNNFGVRLNKHADLGRRDKDGPVICIHVCGDDTDLRIREHIMKAQFGKMGFKLSSGIEGFGRNLYNKRQATQPELPFE
jgi:RHS repeat-associated protein